MNHRVILLVLVTPAITIGSKYNAFKGRYGGVRDIWGMGLGRGRGDVQGHGWVVCYFLLCFPLGITTKEAKDGRYGRGGGGSIGDTLLSSPYNSYYAVFAIIFRGVMSMMMIIVNIIVLSMVSPLPLIMSIHLICIQGVHVYEIGGGRWIIVSFLLYLYYIFGIGANFNVIIDQDDGVRVGEIWGLVLGRGICRGRVRGNSKCRRGGVCCRHCC